MGIVKYFVSFNYLHNNQMSFGNTIVNIRDGITDLSIRKLQKMIEEKFGLTDPIIVNYEQLNTSGGEILDMNLVEKLNTIKESALTMKSMEKDFTKAQIDKIQKGFILGLDVEQVMVYTKPEFNPEQMHQIIIAFVYLNLDIETVSKYAKPEYSADDMKQIFFKLTQ